MDRKWIKKMTFSMCDTSVSDNRNWLRSRLQGFRPLNNLFTWKEFYCNDAVAALMIDILNKLPDRPYPNIKKIYFGLIFYNILPILKRLHFKKSAVFLTVHFYKWQVCLYFKTSKMYWVLRILSAHSSS